jgi:hypothetical protein
MARLQISHALEEAVPGAIYDRKDPGWRAPYPEWATPVKSSGGLWSKFLVRAERTNMKQRWGTRIGKLPATIAISIAIVLAFTASGLTSHMFGYVTQSTSKRVVMNVFGLNARPWDWQFRPVHEVEALDVVRQALLRQQRIHDLPILIRDPWSGPDPSRISLQRNCQVSYGEGWGPDIHLGDCYLIELAPNSFENLLAMTVTLPELTAGVPAVEVKDFAALRVRRSAEIQGFKSLVLHFDPIWSPNGTRLLYTVWEAGKVHSEFLEPPSPAAIRLEPLEENLATRPVWSGDSRFIAYASLRTVKVFDTETRTTRTLRPKTGGSIMVLQFEGTRLRFSHDINWYGGGQSYAYDTARQEVVDLGTSDKVPWSAEGLDLDRHAAVSLVRSPDGRHIAIFIFVDGQRRIEIKTLQ